MSTRRIRRQTAVIVYCMKSMRVFLIRALQKNAARRAVKCYL
jgi:hypothetical protein